MHPKKNVMHFLSHGLSIKLIVKKLKFETKVTGLVNTITLQCLKRKNLGKYIIRKKKWSFDLKKYKMIED